MRILENMNLKYPLFTSNYAEFISPLVSTDATIDTSSQFKLCPFHSDLSWCRMILYLTLC